MSNPFASTSSNNSTSFLDASSAVPVTLQQRGGDNQQQQQQNGTGASSECHVTLPLETLQNLLSQQTLLSNQNISFTSDTGALVTLGQYQQSEAHGAIRKRSHEPFTQEGQ